MLSHRSGPLRVHSGDRRLVARSLRQIRERRRGGTLGQGLRFPAQRHADLSHRRVCTHRIPLHRQARRVDACDLHTHIRGHTRRLTDRRHRRGGRVRATHAHARLAEVERLRLPTGHRQSLTVLDRRPSGTRVPRTGITQRQARRVEASARNAHQTVHAHLAFFSDTGQGRGRDLNGDRGDIYRRGRGIRLVAVSVVQHHLHGHVGVRRHAGNVNVGISRVGSNWLFIIHRDLRPAPATSIRLTGCPGHSHRRS